MARPKIIIDKSQFEKLCGLQCTEEEIACFFDCSVDTVERWCKRTYKKRFAQVYAEKRSLGKISLRRSQFELAKKSPAMAIFLGKNYLGQRDSKDLELSGRVETNNPFADLTEEELRKIANDTGD